MCTISLDTVTEHEYLGICLHHKLSWIPYVDRIRNKVRKLSAGLSETKFAKYINMHRSKNTVYILHIVIFE